MAVTKKGNLFYVVIEEGRDPVTKKRKQKWYSGFEAHEDAVIEERRIKTEMHQGTFVKPTKITLAEYMDTWLESLDVRSSTLESYKWAVESYLKPSMGHLYLTSITPDHIDAHFVKQRKLMEKARKAVAAAAEAAQKSPDVEQEKVQKPLSPTSIKYQYTVLNAILRKATRTRKIPYNPCLATDPPKATKYKPVTLDVDQVKTLLAAASSTNIFVPVMIGITCGLRNGEICGLKWEDINEKEGSFLVNRSLDWSEGKLTPGPPKSDRSERPIPLPNITTRVFATEKLRQDALKDTDFYKDDGYIWTWDDGRPHSPDYLYKQFKKLLIKTGLPNIRVHDLRHSYATLLRDNGIDMETISEILGHYSSAFTHLIYAHPTRNTQKKASQVMDTLLDENQ